MVLSDLVLGEFEPVLVGKSVGVELEVEAGHYLLENGRQGHFLLFW